MNEQNVKGGVNQAKGRAKEEIGHLTGNKKMEGKGILDRVKGKVQQGMGNAKDTAKRVVDTTLKQGKKKS